MLETVSRLSTGLIGARSSTIAQTLTATGLDSGAGASGLLGGTSVRNRFPAKETLEKVHRNPPNDWFIFAIPEKREIREFAILRSNDSR
jgi:hypothetical protein